MTIEGYFQYVEKRNNEFANDFSNIWIIKAIIDNEWMGSMHLHLRYIVTISLTCSKLLKIHFHHVKVIFQINV